MFSPAAVSALTIASSSVQSYWPGDCLDGRPLDLVFDPAEAGLFDVADDEALGLG